MPAPNKKKHNKRNKDQNNKISWNWTSEQNKAYERLKQCLMKPPILGYPDYTKPFELHIDASSHGLGAVLYQDQAYQKRVIAYASRSLIKSEKHYPAHRLEFWH